MTIKKLMEMAEKGKEDSGLSMSFDVIKGEWIKSEYTIGDRKAQNAMQISGIKGRYGYLNIEWTPEIAEEARKRDGGGITVYLQQVAADQAEARQEARRKLPGYGAWE
ncbi:hypothetical protein hairong_140 [Pseudomonas phage hairong]|nr:hypothetical protein hairong_140 [Pseudomonas phage hairong]